MVAPVMKPAAGDRRKHTAPDTCVCVCVCVCVGKQAGTWIIVEKRIQLNQKKHYTFDSSERA